MPGPKGRTKTISRAQRRKLAEALRRIKRSDNTRQRLSAAHELGLQTAAKTEFVKATKNT